MLKYAHFAVTLQIFISHCDVTVMSRGKNHLARPVESFIRSNFGNSDTSMKLCNNGKFDTLKKDSIWIPIVIYPLFLFLDLDTLPQTFIDNIIVIQSPFWWNSMKLCSKGQSDTLKRIGYGPRLKISSLFHF